MSASLVGSEMCIRDRFMRFQAASTARGRFMRVRQLADGFVRSQMLSGACLLYTSDAADDM
eukprot:1505473-Alexandrium_andersonii.AAC.1